MPFTKGSIPPRLKDKGVPQSFADQWIEVWNSVYERTQDEGAAYAQANGVLHKAMVKAGYSKDKDGVWHKGEEVDMPKGKKAVVENIPEGEALIGFSRDLVVVEENDKGMRVKGVALVDEAISKNNRYYGGRFNDKATEETNQYMAQGNLVTLYSRHAKALPHDGAVRDLPVGQVVKPLAREGRVIVYEAVIAPTQDGKDVMALLRTFKKLPTSIRSTRYESRMVQMNGQPVEEMLSAVICGIDFTDEPGIEGAGVREILEEAPKIEEVKQQEEEDMDLKELTLAMLEENRKDLLEQHAATVLEPLRAAMQEQTKKTADLEGANTALSAKVTELEAALAAAGLQTKIAEASLIGKMERTVYEELKQTVHEEADLAKAVPAARDKAFIAYAAGISSGEPTGGNAKGSSSAEKLAEEGKAGAAAEDDDEELTEEFQDILRLAGAKPRVAK